MQFVSPAVAPQSRNLGESRAPMPHARAAKKPPLTPQLQKVGAGDTAYSSPMNATYPPTPLFQEKGAIAVRRHSLLRVDGLPRPWGGPADAA